MPRRPGSPSPRSRTSWLAARISETRASRGSGPSRSAERRASIAIAEATSPPWWPPIPSATANNRSPTRCSSSFPCRTRPTSVAPAARTVTMPGLPTSSADLEGALADHQPVAGVDLGGLGHPSVVEERAVGGPEVLDEPLLAPTEDPGVVLGDERVGEPDLAAVRPPDLQVPVQRDGPRPAPPGRSTRRPCAAAGPSGGAAPRPPWGRRSSAAPPPEGRRPRSADTSTRTGTGRRGTPP